MSWILSPQVFFQMGWGGGSTLYTNYLRNNMYPYFESSIVYLLTERQFLPLIDHTARPAQRHLTSLRLDRQCKVVSAQDCQAQGKSKCQGPQWLLEVLFILFFFSQNDHIRRGGGWRNRTWSNFCPLPCHGGSPGQTETPQLWERACPENEDETFEQASRSE